MLLLIFLVDKPLFIWNKTQFKINFTILDRLQSFEIMSGTYCFFLSQLKVEKKVLTAISVPVSFQQVNDIAHIDCKQINKFHEKNKTNYYSIHRRPNVFVSKAWYILSICFFIKAIVVYNHHNCTTPIHTINCYSLIYSETHTWPTVCGCCC